MLSGPICLVASVLDPAALCSGVKETDMDKEAKMRDED